MHLHGSLGISNEMPFSHWMVTAESLALADGPTETHKVVVARQVLKEYQPHEGLFPNGHLPTRREAARAKFAEFLGAESRRGLADRAGDGRDRRPRPCYRAACRCRRRRSPPRWRSPSAGGAPRAIGSAPVSSQSARIVAIMRGSCSAIARASSSVNGNSSSCDTTWFDEADLQRRIGVDEVAGHRHLARLGHADPARQLDQHGAGVDADADVGVGERCAASEATMKSQARASSKPPVTAGPFTAAIVGTAEAAHGGDERRQVARAGRCRGRGGRGRRRTPGRRR